MTSTYRLSPVQIALAHIALAAFAVVSILLVAAMPSPARAASLTEPQIQAVIGLLRAFHVDSSTINSVDDILHGQTSSSGSFSASPSSGDAPLTVTFNGNGNKVVFFGGVLVQFGDGSVAGVCTPGSGCGNFQLSHTYSAAGTYTAKLIGVREGGVATLGTATLKVEAGSGVPSGASLSVSPSSGTAPLSVTFNGNGANAAYFGGVAVQFGDGSASTVCNPGSGCGNFQISHTYSAAGSYTAKLVGTGEGSSKTLDSVSVRVSGTETIYNSLSASPSSGTAPLAVKFALRGSFSGYTVDFGDGSEGGGAASDGDCSVAGRCSVSHTYSAAGTYTAKLKINGQVVDIETITVSASAVSITASPSSGTAPLAVKFTLKGSFSGYTVDFGDGTDGGGAVSDGSCSSSNCWISHTYAAAGTYTAKLKINGQVVATAAVSVSAPQTNFSAAPSSGLLPLAVKFSIQGAFSSYSIDFGDGQSGGGYVSDGNCSTAGTCSASHTYSARGTYTATLTVAGKQVGAASVNVWSTDSASLTEMLASAAAAPYNLLVGIFTELFVGMGV